MEYVGFSTCLLVCGLNLRLSSAIEASTASTAASLTAASALGPGPVVAPPTAQALRAGRSEDESGGSFSDDIPEFVSSNSTQEVSQGDTVALSCQVNKLASFAIIWSRRHTSSDDWKVLRIGDTPVLINKDDTRFMFEDRSTVLRISDVRREDEGLYKCEIAVQTPSPKIYIELAVKPTNEGGKTSSSHSGATSDSYIGLLTFVIPVMVAAFQRL